MASIKKPKISPTKTSSYETQSPSAEIVANNDHLLYEILLRLPINSLLCFKSVSKHWLSLISDPHFSRQRTPLHNPASGLFVSRSSVNTNPEFQWVNLNRSSKHACSPSTTLSFVNDPFSIKILQSCNGLLLCRSSGLDQRNKRDKLYVYNPTTSHYTILPQLPVDNGVSRTEFSLAFDPSKSPHYKVVCVRICVSITQVEIYSSETVSWRLCTGSFLSHLTLYNIDFNAGVFWNGAVHWMSTWGAATAIYFNVVEERMSEMALPPIPEEWEDWDDSNFGYFGESGGHLHLIGIYDPPSTRFNVYEMESDYSSWLVKFSVDLDDVCLAFPEMIATFAFPQGLDNLEFGVICVVRCVVDEDSYLVMHIKRGILVYYLKSNSFKKLCDIDEVDSDGGIVYWSWFNAYQYIQSLACV